MIDKIIEWIKNLFKIRICQQTALEKLQQNDSNLIDRIIENSNKDLIKLELNLSIREKSGLGSIESTDNLRKEIEQLKIDKFILGLTQKIQTSNIHTLGNLRKHFKNIKPLKLYKGNLIDNDVDWILKLKEKLEKIKYINQPYYLYYVENIKYDHDDFNKRRFFKNIKSTNNIVRLKNNYSEVPSYIDLLFPPFKFDYPSLVDLKGSYIDNIELFIAYNNSTEYVLFIYPFTGNYILLFNKDSFNKKEKKDKTLLRDYI